MLSRLAWQDGRSTCLAKAMPRLPIALLLVFATFAGTAALGKGELARYVLAPDGKSLIDQVSGQGSTIAGFFLTADSPAGTALHLDGYTTLVAPAPIARLTAADGAPWSLSCWLKLDALPWNEAPILDAAGLTGAVLFGVDAWGHLLAEHGVAGRKPIRIVSTRQLPTRTWMLVTVSSSEHSDMLEFSVNGEHWSAAPVEADSSSAGDLTQPLLIGHVRAPRLPYPTNAIHPLLPAQYTLEGAIADLTVRDHALTPGELQRLMTGIDRAQLRQTAPPSLPRWSGGPGPFGAFYTSLKYDPIWDGARRVAPDSDVVVRFPQAPIQLVFWQGANYIPAWVTENNRWYSDEFVEIYGKPRCPDGEDCEPMSDKQVRYSHVRILESSPARVVIHWRYALSEVENQKLADAPQAESWGAWADEYWTVYPDAVAVRKQVLWTDHPQRSLPEFQESIVIIPAGETPEDNINPQAVTLANLTGETRSFTWPARSGADFAKPRGPEHLTGLEDPMIQWVNLRSSWKPFEVAGAAPATFEGIQWEPSLSAFEWWNHWPVAQLHSSGRPALFADRPSHSSLSHIYWPIAAQDERKMSRVLLAGLTTAGAADLAPRARSWLNAPPANIAGQGRVHYDLSQRAYVLEGTDTNAPIRIELAADTEHPLLNPVFVVSGWPQDVAAAIESTAGAPDSQPQLGYVDGLDGRTLIAYVPMNATEPVTLTLRPTR